MRPEIIHDWPRRLSDAAQIQRETIIPRVDLYGVPPDAGLVLGIECAFNEERRRVYCAASLMRFPGFTEIERSLAEYDTPFPHTPELESFREGKVICLALEKIQAKPDILMIHGEGINSPAGAGV
ncbi:MAG: endonuclease V, partial [Candidatus Zixiibacteriota bacterium]